MRRETRSEDALARHLARGVRGRLARTTFSSSYSAFLRALRVHLPRVGAHLDANGVDLDRTRARLAPWLEFEPAAEQFTGNEAANALLRRAYRGSFVVPQQV